MCLALDGPENRLLTLKNNFARGRPEEADVIYRLLSNKKGVDGE